MILTELGEFTDSKNQPIKVNFASKRLIGVGHSMGGVSLYVCALPTPQPKVLAECTLRILAHTLYPVVKFESLILVEPMLITARHFKASGYKFGLDEGALIRRDFWESKEEAWVSLSTKGMKTWDKRVVRLFVVSGAASNF